MYSWFVDTRDGQYTSVRAQLPPPFLLSGYTFFLCLHHCIRPASASSLHAASSSSYCPSKTSTCICILSSILLATTPPPPTRPPPTPVHHPWLHRGSRVVLRDCPMSVSRAAPRRCRTTGRAPGPPGGGALSGDGSQWRFRRRSTVKSGPCGLCLLQAAVLGGVNAGSASWRYTYMLPARRSSGDFCLLTSLHVLVSLTC